MRPIFKKLCLILLFYTFGTLVYAQAIIDIDVRQALKSLKHSAAKPMSENTLSLLVFLHHFSEKKSFITEIENIRDVNIQDLTFIPALAIQMPLDAHLFNQIANSPYVAQVSSYKGSAPELDITAQALKLTPSSFYPEVKNWWAHGYTGKQGVIGIIDTGVDPLHPALSSKTFIVRQESDSGYSDYFNGVKAPHATGVACIYASGDEKYRGIAHGASTIISGPAGEETADPASIMLTMNTLDWMLTRVERKPTIINYSMGNGRLDLHCPACPEWSGLAKVIDYVVNTQKILWVKSAGNAGDIAATRQGFYASTLTVPADNYNGLTIANMNPIKTADRSKHRIKETSSRGPTPFGRRKPDLTAPGHDTRTCAPDPRLYGFTYTQAMDYQNGYRLMGGTSSAAPHVGASALLLQDAGIHNPMAIKALLINSADAWADVDMDHADPSKIVAPGWNRTYGWGYINMEQAFEQKDHLIEDELTREKPVWEYRTLLHAGDKVTLVHERRVGYSPEETEWRLSHLSLEIIDLDTGEVIDHDDSPIDTVHQASNCKRAYKAVYCAQDNKTIHALIRVRLLNKNIDGSSFEPFAIAVTR